MIFSYWGCLLFVVWHAVAAVSNRKTDTLPPSRDLVFCGSICGEGVDALVSVGLVHLFEIRIVLRFWGRRIIHNPEYLFIINLLTLTLNSSSVAFRMSQIVVFVVPSVLCSPISPDLMKMLLMLIFCFLSVLPLLLVCSPPVLGCVGH